MSHELPGLHHVTAIASDPQQNIDFYTGVLGLRLVKITINYDDPSSYHFYYGDEAGTPGSILTFFAWPGGHRGRSGASQATVTAFSVPKGSLGWWQERFDRLQVRYEAQTRRWNEESLVFFDPDGLRLELVAHSEAGARAGWKDGPIAPEFATRGFHHVTLSLKDSARTAALLTETMGFQKLAEEGSHARYVVPEQDSAAILDILTQPELPIGTVGVGNVHHIAFRTLGDAEQQTWQEKLARLHYPVSPVMDRQYFHSIYFREPGGVLFEIATDQPGFTTDETLEQLGTGLCLPDWLEPNRVQIQRGLRPLSLPQSKTEQASLQEVR